MSLPVTTRLAGPYSCNGALVAFDFVFKVFAEADLRVVLTDSAAAETDLVITTNYTVSLNADQENDPGGTITTVSTYATGYKITIVGDLAYGQPTVLTNLGGFFPKTIEYAMDRLGILIQQLKESVGRAVRVPVSSGASGELPAPSAGMAIGWNATEDGLVNLVSVGTIEVSPFAETILDDTTAAAARTTLGAAATADVLAKAGGTMTGGITMSGASIFDANASIAAHATTMNPWSLGQYVTATGAAVTFTGMAAAPQAGAEVEIYMNAAHTFTDGAVFEVDGDANYTAAIGDRVLLRAKSTTVFTVHPRKADGTAVAGVSIASVAETKTGTSAVKSVSPAGLNGAIGFSEYRTSGNQVLTLNTVNQWAHGFTGKPLWYRVVLVCTTNDGDYLAANGGDEVDVTATAGDASAVQSSSSADITNINLSVRSATFNVASKAGAGYLTITAASWRVKFQGWGII